MGALGIFAGYTWRAGKLFRMEALAGVASGYTRSKDYDCTHCGTYYGPKNDTFVMPQLALNLVLDPHEKPEILPEPLPEPQPQPQPQPEAKPQLCFVGCPHMTLKQLQDWTEAVGEGLRKHGRDKVAVPTVFTAPMPVIREFEQSMDAYYLKQSGVVLSYICPLMYMNNPLCKSKAVITSSNKLRTYTSARYYTEAEILEIITGGAK